MDLTDIKPGDTLWYVEISHERLPGVNVTVEKVGRVWLTLIGGRRVNRQTAEVEYSGIGHGTPGHVYRDQSEYVAKLNLVSGWAKFVNVLNHYVVPVGMTAEKIQRMRDILDDKN